LGTWEGAAWPFFNSDRSGEELSLVKAAKAQDVAKCEEALAKGADVHARDQAEMGLLSCEIW